MTTSAFKSSSRKDSTTATAQPPSRRRSHSVSAVSRKTNIKNQETSSISNEFSNSHDNPLFWSTSPPDKEGNGKKSGKGFKNNSLPTKSVNSNSSVGSYEERGRSASRNGQVKRGIGHSLSRGHNKDVVQWRVGNSVTRFDSGRNTIDGKGSVENSRMKKIPNRVGDWSEDDSACSLRASNFEDGVSTFSLSEAEEKVIEAVCEDFNAFLSNDDVNTVKPINVADMPPDMVKPGAVELISDIRREYAMKLEQSEVRARKLRADLAIEEQQRQELDRVLKEIIPDPNTSSVQRPRRGRRRSNERKKMSRCLTEEAMLYFDECVSLSTFDSSDFSASEDPLFISSESTFPFHASSPVKGNPSTMYSYDQDSILHQEEILDSHVEPLFGCEDPRTEINNSITESGSTHQYEFPFAYANQQPKSVGLHEDISSFVKHFEKGNGKDADKSYYDAGEYAANGTLENMLIDRVLYNNRIETGGLLLCGGAISFMPFASSW